ncbi:MAG: hypothetical protein GF384_06400 [Elusimicrobia bacterium]|nr:hypothetical protein [Elusimicrobiota bacterium]MBD3412346.1 hypothetical protein [Elusimicrobiota bacterium]
MRYFLIFLVVGINGCMNLFAREPAPIRFDAFDGGRVGAKAQSMGFAFTAIANNADASFWNPAGLLNLSTNIFSISLDAIRQSRLSTQEIIRGEPLRGRRLTFLVFAGQNGAIGFRPLSDIDETIILDSTDPDRNYEKREVKINSFFLSAASAYNDAMNMGITVAYLNGRLGTVRTEQGSTASIGLDDGNGIKVDWSLLYKPNDVIAMGITGQNLPGIIWWGDYEKTTIPVFMQAGFMVRLTGLMSITYDYEKRFYRDGRDRPQIDHIGMEHIVTEYLKIRGGMYGEELNDTESVHYTAGLGYVKGGYFVDIAMDTYKQLDDNELVAIYDYLVSISIPFASIQPRR